MTVELAGDSAPQPSNVRRLQPVRVLLAGRDRRFIRVTSFLLSRRGYAVSRSSLADAVVVADGERSDVVLVELDVFERQGSDGKPNKVKLSELFAPGKNTLAIYSFMFGPERERPCPGCTHFLDSLDGAARHFCETRRGPIVVG